GRCLEGECRPEGCGDGYVANGEDCDDGNTANGDGCFNCQYESGWICDDMPSQCEIVCGDFKLPQEECDNGGANTPYACTTASYEDCCRPNCTIARCGDNVVDSASPFNEICDAGANNTDGPCDACCRTNCEPSSCGDGIVDTPGGESCEDGNNFPID